MSLDNNNSAKKNKNSVNTAYALKISIVAALGGLLFGYDTAVISGAIGFLQDHFSLSPGYVGWAASSALIGCVIGVGVAGIMSDSLGRKTTLIVSAALFLVSAVGSAVPETFAQFVSFRIIGGIGVGAASMTSPMYIAEISPTSIRGRMVSVNQFAIVFGMLVVYFVNYFIADLGGISWNISTGWRWMFASEALPAGLFLITLWFVPETPRWLTQNGREDKALNILTSVSGSRKGKTQLQEIKKVIALEKKGSIRELFQPGFRFLMMLGIVLAVLQQVTGINVFLYYAPEIFKKLGSGGSTALIQTIVVGGVNLTFTVIALTIVDKVGRKPLLMSGAAGMGISLIALGFASFFETIGLWSLIFILGYIACFAVSLGPVTWVVLTEIFPTRLRGRAMGIATFFLWTANFGVSQTFPILNENPWLVQHFNQAFPFWLYALMCVITVVFVSVFIPETKGKSLEEIEEMWNKKFGLFKDGKSLTGKNNTSENELSKLTKTSKLKE